MDMKPFGIINIFLVALSVVLAPRAAAQTDTVAIVSEKGKTVMRLRQSKTVKVV